MKKNTLYAILLFSMICMTARTQNAPVTTAPFINDAVPGNVNVPVTVVDFDNIGALSLTFLYNPFVLTYQSATPNAAFIQASFTVTSSFVGPGIQKITISYPYGNPAVTLADNSTLVTLAFTFTFEGEFNHSTLTWSDDGTSCEYRNASNIALTDTPAEDFYHDGLVASQVAPVTFLPTLDFYTGGPFQVPITVNNLTNIASISLTFEYDPSVITYGSTFTSPVSGLTMNDMVSTGGKRKIVVGYFGDPVTLTNGSELVSIGFNYISGTTNLPWLQDGVGSCDYGDINYYSLYDSPTSEYYKDGLIFPTPAPRIKADTTAGINGDTFTVPVSIRGFENINSMFLTLDFSDAVLTYQCATLHPDLEGDFTIDDSESGRLMISWSSLTMQSIPDESLILFLAFVYNGGTTALSWFNDGLSCQFTTGPLYTPLTDTPTSQYYFNGLTKPAAGPAVWTGTTSSAWDAAANWEDGIEPESFFDVMITASPVPPNWPEFTGDFTLGEHSRNLAIQGAAQMTVTGDMNIQPGLKVQIIDNGLLKVGGDWVNSGLFDPGSGRVDFYGNQQGTIPEDVYPGKALSNFSRATISPGMTYLSGGTTGPTGDNAHSDAGIGFTFNYLGIAYTMARINTNGWISLDLSGADANSGDNGLLFFTGTPTTVMAPWWDDLNADGSAQIAYKTEGSSPNKVFTVEWKNILSYSSVATARINFQVKLHETTGLIEFCYGNAVAGDHNPAEGASIGMKDSDGGTGHFLEATTGSTSCVITCLACNASWPASNYEFTPPSAPDQEVFWEMSVSKENNAKLVIKRNIHVLGTTP